MGEKQLRILCTGCCGFIGSHLCRRLLEAGHLVRGIDNLSTGFEENVEDLEEYVTRGPNSQWEWLDGDIRGKALDYMTEWHNFDIIYHLAARGETYWCQDNPTEAVDINVNGTIKMLQFAERVGCKYFVFADTSAEYDKCQIFPSGEIDAPSFSTPMGIYSISKMAASQYVRALGKEYRFGTTLFRPFNVYGPSMNLERDIPPVIGSFAVKILKNQRPTIYGNGEKSRDFIYIDDSIDLLMKIIETKRWTEKDSQTYNMGTGKNYSIDQIYDLVSREIMRYQSVRLTPIYEPDKSYEADITLADISKTKRAFDWDYKVDIEEGIHRTVKEIKRKLIGG